MTREELLQTAKPIIFNTEMVRAILDDRKTVTRRIWKDWNRYVVPDMSLYDADKKTYAVLTFEDPEHIKKVSMIERICPICPGDILYVRETFQNCCRHTVHSPLIHSKYCYRASNESVFYGCIEECGTICNWKPSIHMPKEAARIWLNVTDVRVERLQDITEEQAKAEGIRGYSKDGNLYKYAVNDDWWIDYHIKHRKSLFGTWWQDMPRNAKDAFSYLWNSTIKKSDLDTYGWDANPWVWVIEFERIEV